MATRYKNIVGTSFPDYVQEQIKARGRILQKEGNRSSSELQWLTNRNGWVRMSSGAKLKPEGAALSEEQIQEITRNAYLSSLSAATVENTPQTGTVQPTINIPTSETKLPTSTEYVNQTIADNTARLEDEQLFVVDLAKKYVLQGGTISVDQIGTVTPRNTFDSVYKTGATDNLGRKPIPGITNITVGTGGKWQTLLEAEVEFICYDLDQLDIMSKLYMSLGVHVFIEWGHIPYVGNDGTVKVDKQSIIPINFFDESAEYFKDKTKLLQTLARRKEEYSGNYGGIVGRVYNFDWNANPDGSYSCKSYIMGPGGMVESLRINKTSRIDFDNTTTENNSDKYHSDLENVLHSIKNLLIEKRIGGTRVEDFLGAAPSISEFGEINSSNFFQKGIGRNTGKRESKNSKLESYGDLLNRIYSSGNYKGPQFYSDGEKGENLKQIDFSANKFSRYGNAHQIISDIAKGNDGLTALDNFRDDSPVSKFFNGYSVIRSYEKGFLFKTDEFSGSNEYITFGHLMMLIQHLCVLVETDTSSNSSKASFYIDFHPENTKVQTGALQASIDDGVCLVPFKMNVTPTNNSAETAFDAFMWPLETNKTSKYEWETKDAENFNIRRNLTKKEVSEKINQVNKKCPNYDGNLFNILINLDFAINTLRNFSSRDRFNEVNLMEYLYALLDGINIALGKVNNFRIFFDDNSHTLRIIDEHVVEPIKQFITLPNFGLKSLTYDYSYSSKITPRLASQIIIASQAADRGIESSINQFPDDVLSYNKLNGDVRDRFSPVILPSLPSKDKQAEVEQNKLKVLQKLFDLFYFTYSLVLESTNEAYIENLQNTYSDLQGINKKYYPGKSHSLVIPLEYNITMDGIDGILPYSVFLLPDNRLPFRYRGKVGFVVFAIDHNFNNNQWTTTLRGQTILIGGDIPKDDRPVHDTAKNPPALPILTPTGDGSLDPDFTPQGQTEYSTQEVTPQEKGIPATGDVSTQGNTNIPVGLNQLEGNRSINLATLNPRPTTNIPGLIEFIKPREGLVLTAYPDPTDRTQGQGFIQAANTFQETFNIVGVKNETRTIQAGQWYRWTIGYGSHTITAPNGQFRYVKQGDVLATQEDAERDLKRNLQEVYIPIARDACEANGVNFDNLPNNVKIVFVDFTYNYDGHLYNNVVNSYKNGGKQGLINELKRRMSLPGQVPTRRQAEINLLQD
jgi:GH24 family phage-related lysozyme (muramidase)